MFAIRLIVALPLVFFLPGYAIFRSRLFSGVFEDWLSMALASVMASVSIASIFSLFMAELGIFNLWYICLALALCSLFFLLLKKHQAERLPGPDSLQLAILIFLVVVCVLMFFKPAEYIAGDGDPGYYYNIGYNLARTGSIAVEDKRVQKMSDAEVSTYFEKGVSQFIPFHLRNRETGRIEPLLYHLLPTWIAIFTFLFGKLGGLYAAPFFGMLSVLAFYCLSKKYLGKLWGAYCAFLLGVFYPQVWFSRMPTSEVLCQSLFLGAAFFFARYVEKPDAALAVSVSLCLCAAGLARPEATFITALLFIIAAARVFLKIEPRRDAVLANSLLAALLILWFYIRFFEYHYVRANIQKIIRFLGRGAGMDRFLLIYVLAVALGLILVNSYSFISMRLKRRRERLADTGVQERAKGEVPRALASLALLAAIVYFYFSSPLRGKTYVSPQKFFFNASVFLGGAFVVVFALGLFFFLLRAESFEVSFFLALICLFYLVVFSEASITAGYLPWLSRRYLPMLYPMLILGFSYAAFKMFGSKDPGRVTAGFALAACVAVFFLFSTAKIFTHVEYRGITGQIENLSRKVKDGVIIFTSQFLGESVGLPLRYQWGKDSRRIFSLEDSEGLEDTLRSSARQGKKVYIEISGFAELEPDISIMERFVLEGGFGFVMEFPRLAKSYRVMPGVRGRERHETHFYEIRLASASPKH